MRGSCTDRAVVQTLVLLLVLLPVCTCQAASAVETFRPVLTFGSEGNGTGQFGGTLTGPWGISVDESGMIYVADTDNHRVSVFLMDGSPFASWGTGGSSDIRAPHGIAASSDGVSVYVADSSNSRIVRYEVISGSWLDWWGVWPTTTSSLPPGQYPSYPLGVAEGPDGRVWVAEAENGVVRVYTGSGDEVTSFFCNDPRGIAAAGSDNVYVVSGVDGRVYRYSQAGRYLMRFGEPGTGPGQFDHPNGVAVDAAGNVYVADSGNHRVQKFDSGGHFVASFGTRGSGAGQFEYPEGVAVDSSGHVYVTDRNCRVQKFVCEGTDPVSPPAPAYWFSAWGGEAPFGVQFADGSSENPTSWLWEFGDGTTSTEENPYHVFATPGTYSPRLTVTNAAGGASVTLGDRKIVITESPYLFVRTFGSAGTGAGQLLHPRGLALGQDDVLYVMDRGTHRVTAFSSAGAYLFSFGREGSWYGGADPPVEEFLEPAAIATGPAGTVYVGDQDYQRIKVFSANGTPLGQFRPTGSRLTAVAVGPDGSVYVVCSGAKTIERYDAAGGLVASFGTVPPGADAATYAGSPLALACDPEGDVWLLDPGGETMVVREYGPGGAFLAGWGRTGTAPGEIDLSPYSQFQALAVDRSGDVYVTGEDSSIRRFAPDGTFIVRFGSPGTAEGQVGSPVALAVDDQDGVYVASWDGRVQRFTKAGVPAPTHSPVKQVRGGADVPTDTDGDGMYDDVNGNHRPDFADVVLYFNQMSWIAANEPVTAFDCNANGRIDFADVVWLFNHL